MAKRTGASWSDIPLDLAGRILRRLPAHVDRVRFAAVCPQWRAAARQGPLSPPMPLLLLPDATVYSLPGRKPFHFPDCAGYADACGSWLVFSGKDGCFLKDPFSNATVTLPALSRFQIQHVDDEFLDERMDKIEELDVRKIMFCSPRLIAGTVSFTIESTSRIAFAVCQPGPNSLWSVRVDHWAPWFVDIVFHQGKLYALDCMDALFAIDISMDHSTGDPWVSQIRQVINGLLEGPNTASPGLPHPKVAYLVESRGALLVVCQRISLRLNLGQQHSIEHVEVEQNRFEVFQANFGQLRWVKVTTLGDDQVLFLRQGCCRSVCVSHDEVPGDCIFFLENEYEDRHFSYFISKATSSSCSVYSMRDEEVSAPLPTVSWELGRVFGTWLFPQN